MIEIITGRNITYSTVSISLPYSDPKPYVSK